MFHKLLIRKLFEDAIGSPQPGEAPAQVPSQPILTEPTNDPSAQPDDYLSQIPLEQIYPDLVNVDKSDPMALAQFFAQIAQSQMVPSLAAQGTPDEF